MNNGASNIFIGENVCPGASPQESVIIGYAAGPQLNTTGNVNTFIGKDAGRVIKSVLVNTRGSGQTTLDATTLSGGAYQYSLFLDGRLLETKQMVLSK